MFEALYKSVKDGDETRRSLEFNSRKTYRQDLQKELDEIDNQEIWRAGKTVRGLRVSAKLWLCFIRADGYSPTPTRTSSRSAPMYGLVQKCSWVRTGCSSTRCITCPREGCVFKCNPELIRPCRHT